MAKLGLNPKQMEKMKDFTYSDSWLSKIITRNNASLKTAQSERKLTVEAFAKKRVNFLAGERKYLRNIHILAGDPESIDLGRIANADEHPINLEAKKKQI